MSAIQVEDWLLFNEVPTPHELMLLAGKPLPKVPQAKPMPMQRVAPIFGKDPCCFITGNTHIRLPHASFGSELFQGLSLVVDIQPEGTNPSVLMGTGASGRTSLVVHYNEGGVKNRIRVDIQDDNGRSLSARAQLSEYAAKRLFISIDVKNNDIRFAEFNIHSARVLPFNIHPTKAIPVEYLSRDGPNKFSEFNYEIMVGGACIDGSCRGSISTKVGHLIAFKMPLPKQDIVTFFRASQQSLEKFYGVHAYDVDENKERRFLFGRDLSKIRAFLKKPTLSALDTLDASVILFRLLCDRRPLLQDICNELGIQLTFPGMTSTRLAPYRDADLMRKTVSGFVGTLGKLSMRGYQWKPLYRFLEDPILVINGTVVTIEQFIVFVDHKLGGRHFDPYQRRKWQIELMEMTRYWEDEADYFNHQMRYLVRAVYEGIDENRIEEHACS